MNKKAGLDVDIDISVSISINKIIDESINKSNVNNKNNKDSINNKNDKIINYDINEDYDECIDRCEY